ncbi:MAG TPA: hypothetical protein PKE64_25740 [Anaerolineae bacterium]|nr:hypothetical protein [Anaerolineae bacterium]HMR67430.1 hypothetical protein [Anaerolineae bacterium]
MTITQFYRISGVGMLIGGIAFVIHLVLRSLVTAGLDPATVAQQSLWAPINFLGVVGAALMLLGLPVLYAKLAGATGWLGWLGVVLIALAWMFFGLFLSLYSLLVAPWLADQAPALAAAPLPAGILITYITALVAEVVGSVLLAIPFLRGRVQPRWVGYLLPGAAILTVLGNLIAPTGPASNLSINLLSNLGPMLFMGTLACLGYWLGSVDASARQAEQRDAREKVAGSL